MAKGSDERQGITQQMCEDAQLATVLAHLLRMKGINSEQTWTRDDLERECNFHQVLAAEKLANEIAERQMSSPNFKEYCMLFKSPPIPKQRRK